MKELPNPYESKFLVFYRYKKVDKKTYDVDVKTKDGMLLGVINWYAPWRRYVFNPENYTFYDYGCQQEIASVTNFLMEERKQ